MTDPTSTRALLDAVAGGLRVVDLGRLLTVGMPQSPNHPAYWHSLPRRHGDMVRADGGSAANDMISMGTHVGTHVDALAHVSQDGKLYGGLDADQALEGGRYVELGAHTIEPMVRRGVLLDVPGTLGVERLEAGQEITPADLAATAERQGVSIGAGDVVLIRSGWGQHFDSRDGDTFRGLSTGVPGVSEAGARWLAEHDVHAVGADTIAFEMLAPGAGHGLLPAHRVLLVERGIYIVETMDLEELARDAIHEFLFVLSPLPLFGATGSPVRPLAVVGR
ncbi:MAG: cyclase family protein [Nocardioides sp.]